jgi:EAL domain-containing protein (putative c-di-GMP-specific phosphodiesterase class I)
MEYTGVITSELIEAAIDREELSLHYQPRINFSTNQIIGMEALVYWHSKTLGQVDTAHFIHILEHLEIKLIAKFHEWLIRNAFKQIVAWRKIGILVPVDLNFSARYLQENECLSLITNLLQEYDLPPSCFGIEITESYSVSNMPGIIFVLRKFNQMGVRLTLGDFCTRGDSLKYLNELPINKIKLDRRSIHHLIDKSSQYEKLGRMTLEFLIAMSTGLGVIARSTGLGLEVIADGVETTKELEQLKLLGCDSFQGYFFGPPVPANLATAIISNEQNARNFKHSQVSLESLTA